MPILEIEIPQVKNHILYLKSHFQSTSHKNIDHKYTPTLKIEMLQAKNRLSNLKGQFQNTSHKKIEFEICTKVENKNTISK